MKKAIARVDDVREMADAVEAFARDLRKVGVYMRAAERSLDENISRYVDS